MNYRTYLQLLLLIITFSFISCGDCNDNIQNGDEKAIDCGGRCESCPSCSDDKKNGDELGVDCGGICVPCDINVSKELVIIDLNVVNSSEAINGRPPTR